GTPRRSGLLPWARRPAPTTLGRGGGAALPAAPGPGVTCRAASHAATSNRIMPYRRCHRISVTGSRLPSRLTTAIMRLGLPVVTADHPSGQDSWVGGIPWLACEADHFRRRRLLLVPAPAPRSPAQHGRGLHRPQRPRRTPPTQTNPQLLPPRRSAGGPRCRSQLWGTASSSCSSGSPNSSRV